MSEYGDRIEGLADRARRDRAAFDPPVDPPDEERAMRYLREGVGPVVWCYVEGRTGGRMVRFTPHEYDLLDRALNDWLACYTGCYGVRDPGEHTVRTAAKLLLGTHNIRDVAVVMTRVPEERSQQRQRRNPHPPP